MKSNTHRYSKDFYKANDIIKAIGDYRKLAAITMSEEDGYYVCSFSYCILEPRIIVSEFDNYLIELMNSRGARSEA